MDEIAVILNYSSDINFTTKNWWSLLAELPEAQL